MARPQQAQSMPRPQQMQQHPPGFRGPLGPPSGPPRGPIPLPTPMGNQGPPSPVRNPPREIQTSPPPRPHQQTPAAAALGDMLNDDTDYECIVCLDAPPQVIFVPCGHMKTCAACAEKLMKRHSECPLCRTHIMKLIRPAA